MFYRKTSWFIMIFIVSYCSQTLPAWASPDVRTFTKVNILTCNSVFQLNTCSANTHTWTHDAKGKKTEGKRPVSTLFLTSTLVTVGPVLRLLCSEELKTSQTLMRGSPGATWQLLLMWICIAASVFELTELYGSVSIKLKTYLLAFALCIHTH